MPGWEMKIIIAEARRLIAMAADDADLRAELRALAEEILAATGALPHTNMTEPHTVDDALRGSPSGALAAPAGEGDEPGSPTHPVARADRPQSVEPLRQLTLGQTRPSPTEPQDLPAAMTGPVVNDADLPEIEARCRLKAEGARWAQALLLPIREGADLQAGFTPEDPEIVAWADRLVDHFFWMNSPAASQPADISSLDDVGGCFEAIAEALSLVLGNGVGRRGRLERALPLLAEAQSALRAAIQGIHGPDDPDQLQVFEWLKATAARHHVFIKRFMRADDPADPSRWPDLLVRIEEAKARLKKNRKGAHQEAKIHALRSRLMLIRGGKGTEQDWQEVVKSVGEMVAEGIPPSDREIRELLLPVVDDLPGRDDPPDGFRLVLREIDRFLATRTPTPGTAITPAPTAEVLEARRLLGGRSVVLIGGICRRESQEGLKTALGLKELTWIETREHQSIGTFEPAIARPDVALVLLAIRWSSHSFGDVKQFCDRYGKPLVRLPGGYSPNQVAAQILAQCSEQLRDG